MNRDFCSSTITDSEEEGRPRLFEKGCLFTTHPVGQEVGTDTSLGDSCFLVKSDGT